MAECADRIGVWVTVIVGLEAEAKKKAKRNKCAYVVCFQTGGDPAYTYNTTCTLTRWLSC
jgi:hypothetical protein